ncbi:MAG: MBL fold metallo-hydrolase [Acidobacteriia bacterium]|nr:MBL fold metallo-hydrolase [Terriglobia bacterium]
MSGRRLFPLLLIPFAAFSQPAGKGLTLETVPVHGNVYLIATTLGNIAVQTGKDPGHDGILLVDTGPPGMTPAIVTEIRKLSDAPVRFIVNTSADRDHTGGNDSLVKPGAKLFYQQPEVGIFAQDNVLTRMSGPQSNVPSAAWPTLTFDRGKRFEFNGETVELLAEKNAHTDGDGIVFFRGSNVIATGDIFRTTGYPVIDVPRGGTIQGEIKALNHLLELTVPHAMQEGGTMVIPGHGRLCDQADVTDYRDMLTIIRDRVADLIRKGKTLEEVKAARPTRDYDRRFSTSEWTGEMLVEAVYKTLKAGNL